jgi:PAS domain S-box-containing protein
MAFPSPLRDASGTLIGAVNMLVELSEQQRAKRIEGRLAAIVESSVDAIISKDLNGVITTWNKAAERMFGYLAAEAIGRPITILIPPDRHNEELEMLARIQRGEHVDFETVRRRKDGSLINVSLTVSPLPDESGKIVGASKIARDITDQKRTEERQKVLMAELDHRVKNALARVDVVAMSTRQSSNSVDEFVRSLRGRIQSMAVAHKLLSQTGWLGVGLTSLVHAQLAPYETDGNITISGIDLTLAAEETQAVAMVLHELVTNAAKYGALSVPEGQVSVSWDRKLNGDATTTLVLEWRELRGPPVAAEVQSGYGTGLIRNLVPHELGGKVDLVFDSGGVICRIEIPVEKTETQNK